MFSPEDLVSPKSLLQIDHIVQTLDTRFQKLVSNGWFDNWHKNRIYVQVLKNVEPKLYAAILESRSELTELYKKAGWKNVTISTSAEQGERDGILSVQLES